MTDRGKTSAETQKLYTRRVEATRVYGMGDFGVRNRGASDYRKGACRVRPMPLPPAAAMNNHDARILER